MSKKKDDLLGMSFGTACARLRKLLLFTLAQKLGLLTCYRCKQQIAHIDDLTIEHKNSWQDADDPVAAFFDLGNVAFSHAVCNFAAARRPNKKYATPQERSRANFKIYYTRHGDAWNARRNKRRKKQLATCVADQS